MKIAIVQFEPVRGDIEKNIEIHIYWINKAIKTGADWVLFPELSLTGYEPDLAASLATDQNDKRLNCFQKLSDENNLTIALGLPTLKENDLNISMVIFQSGRERITYSKQYLYHTEISFFKPAYNPFVINANDEIIAPAICFELSNQEHIDFAVQNSATIYLASVLNSITGVESDIKKLGDIAKKHKMVTFMANYSGESGGYRCAGKSTVWDKNGELIKQLGEKDEGLIVFDTKSEETITVTYLPHPKK